MEVKARAARTEQRGHMNRSRLPLIPPAALASLMLLMAPQANAQTPPTTAQQIELGRAIVLRNCGMCHAVGANDISANPQAPAFRKLGERMDVEQLGEGLATGILTNHPAMPEFRLEPHEVVAIVRYLRSIQERSRAEAGPRPTGPAD